MGKRGEAGGRAGGAGCKRAEAMCSVDGLPVKGRGGRADGARLAGGAGGKRAEAVCSVDGLLVRGQRQCAISLTVQAYIRCLRSLTLCSIFPKRTLTR